MDLDCVRTVRNGLDWVGIGFNGGKGNILEKVETG